MKTIAIALISVFLFTGFSCQNTKKASSTSSDSSKKTGASSTISKNTTYRLVVSFISIGSGIDATAKSSFDELITKTQKETGKSVDNTPAAWGREGEVDYCMTLTNLSKEQQTKFVAETKKILSGNSLVFITENSECKHKR